ncbi:MAG: sterol desaturase/sphingolipid hydroxylase (fatty acid hydroxylase superfamily) [Lentisphaeria bacterium]|jgi:sterol desaturase/sphingolipid hydroxylase (fatty acid hydroxylase superfamily)
MIVEVSFISVLVMFFAVDYIRGSYRGREYFTMRNMGVNLIGVAGVAVSRPLMAFLIGGLLVWVFPYSSGGLSSVDFSIVFIIYILLEDYLNYWLHRAAHVNKNLWLLHKVHHCPDTMDATVVGRHSFVWWCMVPTAWLGAIVIWAGMGEVVVYASLIKGLVGILQHCNVRWDLRLLDNKYTRPFMWLYMRIIAVPDTHHYHHNLEGGEKNYGALFILWDLIHGTAVFPNRQVKNFGLYDKDEEDEWYVQVFQPFVRARKQKSSNNIVINETSNT